MTGGAVGSRLYERTAEIAAIEATLARLTDGRGSTLLFEGRAGRGKSALLAYAAKRGRESGARTLGARARHLSSAAPFEVLRRLLGPAVEDVGGPDALTGAARFAIPLFTPGADLTNGVDYGCQWLIAWLAEQSPLVLVVDDAHWADGASMRVLLDLQAEISVQRVAMFVGSRPVENPEVQRLLASLAVHPDCDVLVPGALSRDAVAELVADRLGREADGAFVDECLKASGGNAFYLGELVRPFESDPDAEQHLALDGSTSLRRMVSMRLGELGADATMLAQAAAVLGDGTSLSLVATLADIELSSAVREAARLEVASVLAHGDPVEFLHPLVRAAIDAELPAVVSGELHGRAARLLREAGGDPGAVAQHLVASPGTGDDEVTAFLVDQGQAALEAGSVAIAQQFLQRALDEPASVDDRPRILLWLGRAEHMAMELDVAREHLEEAFASSDREVSLSAAGDLIDVLDDANQYDELGAVVDRVIELQPFGTTEAEVVLQASLFIVVIMGMVVGLDDLPPQLANLDARALPTDRDVDRHLAVWAAVHQRSRPGGTTAQLMVELRRVVASLPPSRDDITVWDVRTALAAAAFLEEENYDESDDVLDRVAPAAARLAGTRPQLQAELDHRRCGLAITRGQFEDAKVLIEAAEAFTDRHGVIGFDGLRRFSRGRIALEQGDFELAAELFEERVGEDLVYPALGALLGGDVDRAVAILDGLDLSTEPDTPLRQIEVELQPHLLASHVHEVRGDRERAVAEARREVAIRRRYGPDLFLAQALRREASFLPAREAVGLLEEALALVDSTSSRPVLARVRASYGLAMQRAGRESAARDELYLALDLATHMGLQRVVRRAKDGLVAAGGRPRRSRATGPTSLTESQGQVAALAAEGLTNREIAERLFVTIKTVETHLMAVYRKLGIKGRDELTTSLLPSPA